jgi:hypothetical protein
MMFLKKIMFLRSSFYYTFLPLICLTLELRKSLSVAPTWHWLFFALNFAAVTVFKIYLFLYVTSKISANHGDVANHARDVSSFMPKKF